MKIRITESELVSMIKQIINEGGLMANFLSSNDFRNCRGVRLSARGGTVSSDGGGLLTNVGGLGLGSLIAGMIQDRKERREINRENKKEKKEFEQKVGEQMSLEYYLDLKNELQKYNALSSQKYYSEIYDENGKPFTKNTTQKNVNLIELLMKDNSFWLFFYRDHFGSKIPTLEEFYNYMKTLGGEKGLEEITNKNYNYQVYRERLEKNVEEFNEELKKKYPFENPTGKTPFYIVWFVNDPQKPDRSSDGVPKLRYFNTYEEQALASQVVETEGNKVASSELNPAGGFARTSFQYKPKGKATDLLFK